MSVVGFGCDAQQVAHQGVYMHRLKWLHYKILPEGRSHCTEEWLHVQIGIVKAMLSFIHLHWEVLQEKFYRINLAET